MAPKPSSNNGAKLKPLDGPEIASRASSLRSLSSEYHARPKDQGDESCESDDDPLPEPGLDFSQIQKKAQKDIFQQWLHKNSEDIVRDAEANQEAPWTSQDDYSIRRLMADKDMNVKIIGDPREYQIALFERAKEENVIAVLDTGSGKTLIAALLLRHVLDMELEFRAAGKSPKTAFFIVDRVALVHQQFAVLECNLSHKIARLSGMMNVDTWSKDVWSKMLEDNMVIVCTAEVLVNALTRSYVTIPGINLICFDEAHHAKKNHAYARIIDDFYLKVKDERARPRIFGMTASPVDAKEDPIKAGEDLERRLNSKIVTSADMGASKIVASPQELLMEYDALPAPYQTRLCKKVRDMVQEFEALRRMFFVSELTAAELGEWAADRLWEITIKDEGGHGIEHNVQKLFNAAGGNGSTTVLDNEMEKIDRVRKMIDVWEFPEPTRYTPSISDKVRKLLGYLDLEFETENTTRCIIFVKRRTTARLLTEILQTLGPKPMRTSFFMGTNAVGTAEARVSIKRQLMTLHDFRTGVVNCLVATSVAEEGIDIPSCNSVIRFDLFDTMIQYVQSRGRARHKNSKYLHMLESGNRVQFQTMTDATKQEGLMRDFCKNLPQDRKLLSFDDETDLPERSPKTYTEPSTGAHLTYNSSLMLIQHFAATLPSDHESPNNVLYLTNFDMNGFSCEVLLPPSSPIRTWTGTVAARKALAKRAAAFELCVELRKGGYLDANLVPIYRKQLPAMRNSKLAQGLMNSSMYDMKSKPNAWEFGRHTFPNHLWLTVITFGPNIPNREVRAPLGLLTRTKMPQFPEFNIFPGTGEIATARCSRAPDSLKVGIPELDIMTTFTLRVFQDLFNKVFERDVSKMPYWIVPVQFGGQSIAGISTENLINWDVLNHVNENESEKWTPDTPTSSLLNRFVMDPKNGGRRLFSLSLRPDLRQMDVVPEDAAIYKHMANILEYSVSLWGKTRQTFVWHRDQPVLKTRIIQLRRNWLDEMQGPDEGSTTAYIIPEPMVFSQIPVDFVASAYIFPCIISRYESYLVAHEAFELLEIPVSIDRALEALTRDTSFAKDDAKEQLHVEHGMGKNYERLEFLGDSFLKMATSISLYAKNAHDNEFESHVKRMLMLCNKNLFNTAIDLKLYEHIRTQGFSRRTWYPEGLKLLQGKTVGFAKSGPKHALNEKSIADVCEAIIGAAFLTCQESDSMDLAVSTVTTMVSSEDHDIETWADYWKLYTEPKYLALPPTASQADMARKIGMVDNYTFKNYRLLRTAFMHPTYPFSWEKIPSYQRLEFLGDALLDMATINWLFKTFPDRDPQWLTEHKMAMVGNKFLGALSVKLGFNKFLLHNSTAILNLVKDYVLEVQQAEQDSNGSRDYWNTTRTPPKCLPDLVESYVGAMFVDSGFDYKQVERFFDDHVLWFFENMSLYDGYANNQPTSHLSNRLIKEHKCRTFRIMVEEIPPLVPSDPPQVIAAIMIHTTIMASARGTSGRYARLRASEAALEAIDGLRPWEFREKYGCDCNYEGDEDDAR